MARMDGASVDHIDQVENEMKHAIQGLYQLMVQVTQYDNIGPVSSKEVVANELKTLSSTLQNIHSVASSPAARLPHVPQELIAYVENGRNPDIYTREFVEMLRRGNQLMRGKIHAYESFRDILAAEMRTAMPELREDVDRVIAATTVLPSADTNPETAASNGNAQASTSAAADPAARQT